jgi:hypothetical protein
MSVSSPLSKFSFLGLLLLALALPAWSREEQSAPPKKKHRSWMDLSDQDTIVPVSSVEWGTPDRWSLTARYVHFFEKDRNYKRWLHNLTVALSPGTDGGRLGVGYLGVFSPDPASKPDWAMFIEARTVLLRTWSNPLETEANRTFVGAEIRFAPTIFFNIGGGYYRQVSSSDGSHDSFWGYHIGIGM